MIFLISFLLSSAHASLPEFYLPWQGKALVTVAQETDAVFGYLDRDEFIASTDCTGTPLKVKDCFRSKTDQYFYIGQIFYQVQLITPHTGGVAIAGQSVHFPEQWVLVRTGTEGTQLTRWEQDREVAIPFYEVSKQGPTQRLRPE